MSPPLCPACQSSKITRHCPSPTCTWIICRGCDHYGYANGRRWARYIRGTT